MSIVGLVVGEVLVMLAGVPLVDRPQGEDVDPPVHDVLVHCPFDEVAGDEDRDRHQPLPAGILQLAQAVPDGRKPGRVDHADVDQAVVHRADLRDVLLAEAPLAIAHHGKFLLLQRAYPGHPPSTR